MGRIRSLTKEFLHRLRLIRSHGNEKISYYYETSKEEFNDLIDQYLLANPLLIPQLYSQYQIKIEKAQLLLDKSEREDKRGGRGGGSLARARAPQPAAPASEKEWKQAQLVRPLVRTKFLLIGPKLTRSDHQRFLGSDPWEDDKEIKDWGKTMFIEYMEGVSNVSELMIQPEFQGYLELALSQMEAYGIPLDPPRTNIIAGTMSGYPITELLTNFGNDFKTVFAYLISLQRIRSKLETPERYRTNFEHRSLPYKEKATLKRLKKIVLSRRTRPIRPSGRERMVLSASGQRRRQRLADATFHHSGRDLQDHEFQARASEMVPLREKRKEEEEIFRIAGNWKRGDYVDTTY